MSDSRSTSDFVMHGTREVLMLGAAFIKQQVEAIESAIGENPGLAVDLAYTLVDTSCKTILRDRGHNVGRITGCLRNGPIHGVI